VPVFFLSSSRRHTSFSRDWSSDVCSSDLSENTFRKYRALLKEAGLIAQPCEGNGRGLKSVYVILPYSEKGANGPAIVTNITEKRSEERRVGKGYECRRTTTMRTHHREITA